MRFAVSLFALLHVLHSTKAAFTFVLQINRHTTRGSCDTFVNPSCETYFSLFCLRESRADRSTNTVDCPLGAYHQRFSQASGRIAIQSSAEWKGGFQLFIQAFDDDDHSSDDHLDDIFVGGSLTDNTLTSAMNFTGGRVSVTVQFKRTCDANYYGVSCFTYCVPADNDADGHFTCNASDGSKLCLPGYSNPDNNCQENINDCASGPCHNGGNCTDLVADFACTCPPGYTNKNCSLEIDECEEAYCPGNSTCVDYVDDYICVCNPGYTGENCTEHINDCASDPCRNGGNCTDLVADFACACPPGYTGKNCSMDIDECQEVGCPGNSTCMDSIDDFTCVCNPGYTGQNCTEVLDPCESDICVNGGTCVVVDPFSSMCVCPAGYTGPVCEVNIDECLTADCPLGNTCQDGVNSYKCLKQPAASSRSRSVVGVVIGALLLLIGLGICIFIFVIVIFLAVKHKGKCILRPSKKVSKEAETYAMDEIETNPNPLYGREDISIASSQLASTSGVYHNYDNSLYNGVETQADHTVAPGSTPLLGGRQRGRVSGRQGSGRFVLNPAKTAYNKTKSPSIEVEVNNPLYNKDVAESPVYSFPKFLTDSDLTIYESPSALTQPMAAATPDYEEMASLVLTDPVKTEEELYESISDFPKCSKDKCPLIRAPLRTAAADEPGPEEPRNYRKLEHGLSHQAANGQPCGINDPDCTYY